MPGAPRDVNSAGGRVSLLIHILKWDGDAPGPTEMEMLVSLSGFQPHALFLLFPPLPHRDPQGLGDAPVIR